MNRQFISSAMPTTTFRLFGVSKPLIRWKEQVCQPQIAKSYEDRHHQRVKF